MLLGEYFNNINFIACADINYEVAKKCADEYKIKLCKDECECKEDIVHESRKYFVYKKCNSSSDINYYFDYVDANATVDPTIIALILLEELYGDVDFTVLFNSKHLDMYDKFYNDNKNKNSNSKMDFFETLEKQPCKQKTV